MLDKVNPFSAISAGTTLASRGTVVFSNSNGVSFGLSGSTVTASVLPGGVALSAGTQSVNTGTVTFANSNGISFGMSGSDQITASYTVPSTAGLISNVNVSAGTTSNNLSALTFSNSNGVSFGINASTITASIATSLTAVNVSAGTTSSNLSALVFSNSNNVSFGLNGSTVTATITVPAQTTDTGHIYASSNTFGTSSGTYNVGTLSIAGSGAVSVAASNSGWIIFAPTQTVQTQNCVDVTLSGNSTSAGAGYILISSGTMVLAGGNNVTLSQNGQSVTISGANAAGAQTGISSIAGAGGTQTAGMVSFANSNGVTFGMSTGAVTGTITASIATSLTNINVSAGTTSNNLSAITFSNSNGVSFGLNASTLTGSVAAQTVQTQNCVDATLAGNSTSAGVGYILVSSGTMTLAGGNNITLSQNGNAITISGANIGGAQTGISGIVVSNTTYTSGTVSFSNANGISFGSSAGQAITASYTVPTQTNQAGSVYASSNTFGTSSGTYDARTLSIAGSGAISVAASNSGWVISAPVQSVQTQNCVDLSLSGNSTSAGAGYILISSGTAILAGGNNITLSQNGQSITISGANVGGAQTGISGLQVSNTTYTSGTVTFQNANGISFGSSGANGISASYTVPATVGLISNVNVSAGTTSNNLSALTFSNGSGVSFGLNASTITASVAAQTNQSGNVYASSNTFGTSSGTYDARTLSIAGSGAVSVAASNSGWVISAPIQTNQTLSAIVSSNTVGNTSAMTFDARSVSFQGYGAASVGLSTTNTGSSILISVPTQTVQTQNCVDVTLAGNSTSAGAGYILVSSGTLTLAGGNNITLSQNGNAITVSGANVGGAQTGISSIAAAGGTQTVGMASFINSNNITFGMSTGANTGSVTASFALNVSAGGGTSNALSGITFSNSNGVTFGLSTGAGVGTLTASYTVPAQSNQTLSFAATSNTAGNTSGMTVDARSMTLAGYGAASVGYSTSAGGTTALVSVATQTAQTQSNIQAVYDGANSISTGTIRFTNANGISFSINGQTLSASVAAQTNQTISWAATSNTAGNTSGMSVDARSLTIAGYGGLSVGFSTSAGGSSVVFSMGTQTNQTGNVYASSNTFGTSSGTYDARSISIAGSGVVSVAASNSGWVIDAPASSQSLGMATSTAGGATGGTSNTVSGAQISYGFYAGSNITLSQSANGASGSLSIYGAAGGGGGSVTFSAGVVSSALNSIVFSNANGISFGLTSSTITASVAAQTNQTGGVYASSNTTSTSSGTYDARSLNVAGAGAISIAASNSGFIVSSPVTSSLSATGWASVATAGSTISVGATYTGNVYAAGNTFGTSSGTCDPRTVSLSGISGIQVAASNSGWMVGNWPNSVFEPYPIITGTAFSSHAPASWWFNRFTIFDPVAISNINVVKSLSPGVPLAMTLLSSGTLKCSYSHGVTIFSRQNYAAQSTNLTTVATASIGFTATLSYATSSVSAAYSYVTDTTGGTTSFSTTTTGGNWSNYFSGPTLFQIPCITTLVDGEYFIAHQHSTTAATNGSAVTLMSFSNLHIVPQVVNVGVLGQSNTQASLNPWGMGAGIASAVTTNNSMAGSVISGATQNNWYVAMSNA